MKMNQLPNGYEEAPPPLRSAAAGRSSRYSMVFFGRTGLLSRAVSGLCIAAAVWRIIHETVTFQKNGEWTANIESWEEFHGGGGEGSEKTIVIYSGPTSLNASEGKHWLYLKNFEYFMMHGIDCLHQDTVLVLTETVVAHYDDRIAQIRQRCDSQRRAESSSMLYHRTFRSPSVRVIHRQDRCYHMESFRMALEHIDFSDYEFTVYLNCGVVGPKLAPGLPMPKLRLSSGESGIPWTRRYTSLLSETVKMAGLSINAHKVFPHVQSMLFAVDRKGLEVIKGAGAVFDCGKNTTTSALQKTVNDKYEVEMGRAMLAAGYHIRSTHGIHGPVEIRPQDEIRRQIPHWCKDMWHPAVFRVTADSKWEDFMFFKSSRLFLLPGMEEEIQYKQDHEFVILKLPVAGVTVLDVDKDVGNDSIESLWNGGASKGIYVYLSTLRVSVVISHCKSELSWLREYLADIPLRNVTVVSKCGMDPDPVQLPPGTHLMKLPKIGGVDHTMAYWMVEVLPKDQDINRNDILIFLNDNLESRPPRRRRNLAELLRLTAVNSFACLQMPKPGHSQFHVTEVLAGFNMSHYNEDVLVPNDPNEDEFKSSFENLKEWQMSVGLSYLSTAELVPVCYGGSYAVLASLVLEVPANIRSNLLKSLSRGNNIEEGHFAERTWAALFWPTLSKDQAKYVFDKAKYVQKDTMLHGGGTLGALAKVEPHTKTCALLFFGLAKKFRGIVLPSIQKNILHVSENGSCDIFLHNFNITSISNPRGGEQNNSLIPTEVYDLTSNVVMDTPEEFLAKRNMSYYAGPDMMPRWTLGWDQVALENMYKQWHSIERVWDLMQDTEQRRGIEYERVGLFRTDVQYVTPINIFDGDAVIPRFGFLVNDRMFYGKYEYAQVWAKSRFPSVPYYTPRHPWIKMHSEFFMNDFVLKHIPNVTVKDNICFYRVRANGDIWDNDCRRAYRFPQFLIDANLTYSR